MSFFCKLHGNNPDPLVSWNVRSKKCPTCPARCMTCPWELSINLYELTYTSLQLYLVMLIFPLSLSLSPCLLSCFDLLGIPGLRHSPILQCISAGRLLQPLTSPLGKHPERLHEYKENHKPFQKLKQKNQPESTPQHVAIKLDVFQTNMTRQTTFKKRNWPKDVEAF